MSVEGVARGLLAMDDDAVRAAVRGGDLSSIGEVDLSDAERQLLTDAAEDEPDVEGFIMETSAWNPAVEYVTLNRSYLTPQVHESFSAWLGIRYGGIRQIESSPPCLGHPG